MLKKLVISLIVLAMAVPAFATTARVDVDVQNHAINPVTVTGGDRADVEFNTGGVMNYVPEALGSATGWAYFSAHIFTNGAAQDLALTELAFPTCENSTDPIDMPVDWFVEMGATDVNVIVDPWTHAYTFQGLFTPTNLMDSTADMLVYDAVDVTAENIVLAAGETMIWGYENAGLQGMTAAPVEVTYGFWVSFWDDDSAYGRTALMQLMGDYVTTATEEASLSQIKALY
jgi:hypothetical protein